MALEVHGLFEMELQACNYGNYGGYYAFRTSQGTYLDLGHCDVRPEESEHPDTEVLGPNCHAYNDFWSLLPSYLGMWSLRESRNHGALAILDLKPGILVYPVYAMYQLGVSNSQGTYHGPKTRWGPS